MSAAGSFSEKQDEKHLDRHATATTNEVDTAAALSLGGNGLVDPAEALRIRSVMPTSSQ